MNTNSQKGFAHLVPILLIAAAAAGVMYYMHTNSNSGLKGEITASESHGRPSRTPKPPVTPNPTIGPCMLAAVDRREISIKGAVTTYSAALATALDTRKAALDAAWSLPFDTKEHRETLRAALKAAWEAFKTTKRAARKTHQDATATAWHVFESDRQDCKGPADGGSSGADINL